MKRREFWVVLTDNDFYWHDNKEDAEADRKGDSEIIHVKEAVEPNSADAIQARIDAFKRLNETYFAGDHGSPARRRFATDIWEAALEWERSR